MYKKIEEEILSTIKWLTREHKLKEDDINRLKKILIRIAYNYFGDRLYSGKNVDNIGFEGGAWFIPNLHSYLSQIPHHKVFELFENNDINDLCDLEYLFDKIDFDLFYTYEELNNIIKSFITYLLNNRNEIISTGFPLKSFESSLWFYRNLSKLYPLKIPYLILRKEKDKEGNFLLEYHWIKNPEHLFNSSDLKKQDFVNAPYNSSRYSFSTIDLIENKRPILFELKIEILNILFDALLDKNCVGLWEKCFRHISNKLELEDFNSLIKINEMNYIFTDIYSEKNHKNLFNKYNISRSDNHFELGGLTQIIELIFRVEKELRLGHINKIKTKLLDLVKNKKISTYYDLLLNINISDLLTIGEEYYNKYEEEENEYKVFFKDRLSNYLKKSFKTPSFINPNDYNLIRQFVNLFESKINTNIPESEEIYKPNKKNIIPIKMPPNTKWEQIILKFIDNESIEIKGPDNYKEVATFREMGFENRKKSGRPPSKLWDFLRALAHVKGTFSWDLLKKGTRNPNIKDAMDNATKRKQLVNQKLKAFFNLKEDPITYDRKNKIYQTRFEITSENELF